MELKRIPDTSPILYISGLQSLNLDLRDGTGVGWHFSNVWSARGKGEIKLYGKGTKRNTLHILGSYGIADRSKILKYTLPVYIANHYRAAVDLVYVTLVRHNMIGELKGSADHFFPEGEQKEELVQQLLKLLPYLDEERRKKLERWMLLEFGPIYRSVKIRAI